VITRDLNRTKQRWRERPPGFKYQGAGDWTQVDPIRHGADDHRDRKCRETEDTRDEDFKIKQETRHKNSRS